MMRNGGLVSIGLGILIFGGWPARAEAATDAAPEAEAVVAKAVDESPYVPTPQNLAARKWFQDARFGVFIHWGVYSVLGRGEWVMNIEKMPVSEYEKLPPQFNPEKFNAAEWVALFKKAGAKYITITSKHHDGFAMWDSKVSDWDIVDRTPYKRDVLKQLADECAKQGMKLFFYHSQLDWHHPDYYPARNDGQDRGPAGTRRLGEVHRLHGRTARRTARRRVRPSGRHLVRRLVGPADEAIATKASKDADPRATNIDWHLRRTYDMIHALQPACLIGANHHVRPFAGEDFQMFERDLPGENKGGHSGDAEVGNLPLETCDTINGAWGYNAGDKKFKSVPDLIRYLVRAAGRNANFLLNIGPRPDGTIDPEFVSRLEGIGAWLDKYGHTIYGTRGGPIAPQTWGVTTHTADAVYLHVLDTSQADKDGWLVLSGTEDLDAAGARLVTKDATGQLAKSDASKARAARSR